MRGPRSLLLAILLPGLLALAACGGQSTPTANPEPAVSVDTAMLRQLRAQAKIDPCRNGSAAPSPNGLPQVTLPCLGGGQAVDLSTLRGPMILPLWASWCVNCPTEMPLFQRFYKQYGKQVPVLGIDFQDTSPEAALRLMLQKSATYPVVADPGGDVRVPFRVRGLPGIVFVKPDGTYSVRLMLIDSYASLVSTVSDALGLKL